MAATHKSLLTRAHRSGQFIGVTVKEPKVPAVTISAKVVKLSPNHVTLRRYISSGPLSGLNITRKIRKNQILSVS